MKLFLKNKLNDKAKTKVKSKENTGFEWRALKTLSHYLWPPHEFEMKVRVILSLLLLALAKVANVYTPILFRDVVDILSTKA